MRVPQLQDADLVFVRGTTLIAKLIIKFQRAKGEVSQPVSHVAGVVEPKLGLIVEANPSGVELTNLFDRYADGKHLVAIFRSKNITAGEKAAIVFAARREVGKKYAYLKLAAHWLDNKLFGGKYITRRIDLPGTEICSELWAKLFDKLGYNFKVPAGGAQPDDMYRFCLNEPDKWECIFPLSTIQKP